MFEQSPTLRRYQPAAERGLGVHLGYVPALDERPENDRRALRWAVAVAVALHVALFSVVLPERVYQARDRTVERPVFVVTPVRFEPPQPAAQRELPRPHEARRVVPIPDPTPDDPEPLIVDELPAPEFVPDLAGLGAFDGPIAEAPPGPQPFAVGGDVTAPVKIYGPSPTYTEDARVGRVQGVVILEAVIDALGNVTQVKVLKGLPLGLSESAVEAARTWRFEPARRGGEPVPVFYNLTVRFSLQ